MKSVFDNEWISPIDEEAVPVKSIIDLNRKQSQYDFLPSPEGVSQQAAFEATDPGVLEYKELTKLQAFEEKVNDFFYDNMPYLQVHNPNKPLISTGKADRSVIKSKLDTGDFEPAIFKPTIRPTMEPLNPEIRFPSLDPAYVKEVTPVSALPSIEAEADARQKRREGIQDVASAIAIGSGSFADNIAGMFGRKTDNAGAALAIKQNNEGRREAIATREAEMRSQTALMKMKEQEHQDDMMMEGLKLDQEYQIAKMNKTLTPQEQDMYLGSRLSLIAKTFNNVGKVIVGKYSNARIQLDGSNNVTIYYENEQDAARIQNEIADAVQEQLKGQGFSDSYLSAANTFDVIYRKIGSNVDDDDAGDRTLRKGQQRRYDRLGEKGGQASVYNPSNQ